MIASRYSKQIRNLLLDRIVANSITYEYAVAVTG